MNNFVNWSLPSQPARQQCQSINTTGNITGNLSYTAIGPFSSTLNATKLIQFSPDQGVTKLLVKVAVGVSDNRIIQGPPNSTQKVEFVTINGTLYRVVTNVTLNGSARSLAFITLEVRDQLAGNRIIQTISSGYQTPSIV